MPDDKGQIIIEEEKKHPLKEIRQSYKKIQEENLALFSVLTFITTFAVLTIATTVLISIFDAEENIATEVIPTKPTPQKPIKPIKEESNPTEEYVNNILTNNLVKTSLLKESEVMGQLFTNQIILNSESQKNKGLFVYESSLLQDMRRLSSTDIQSIMRTIPEMKKRYQVLDRYLENANKAYKNAGIAVANMSENENALNRQIKALKSEKLQEESILQKAQESSNGINVEESVGEIQKLSTEIARQDSLKKISRDLRKNISAEQKKLEARIQGVTANKEALVHDISITIIKDMNLNLYEGRPRKQEYISSQNTDDNTTSFEMNVIGSRKNDGTIHLPQSRNNIKNPLTKISNIIQTKEEASEGRKIPSIPFSDNGTSIKKYIATKMAQRKLGELKAESSKLLSQNTINQGLVSQITKENNIAENLTQQKLPAMDNFDLKSNFENLFTGVKYL